jgi:hypothetical protein
MGGVLTRHEPDTGETETANVKRLPSTAMPPFTTADAFQ